MFQSLFFKEVEKIMEANCQWVIPITVLPIDSAGQIIVFSKSTIETLKNGVKHVEC